MNIIRVILWALLLRSCKFIVTSEHRPKSCWFCIQTRMPSLWLLMEGGTSYNVGFKTNPQSSRSCPVITGQRVISVVCHFHGFCYIFCFLQRLKQAPSVEHNSLSLFLSPKIPAAALQSQPRGGMREFRLGFSNPLAKTSEGRRGGKKLLATALVGRAAATKPTSSSAASGRLAGKPRGREAGL